MANLAATVLQEMVAVTPSFDKNEELTGLYGGLATILKQTNDPLGIVTPELVAMAANSWGRSALKVPVLKKKTDVAVGATRHLDLSAGYINESAMESISFSPYVYQFSMIEALNATNYISYERDLKRKLDEMENAIIQALDIAACSLLSTRKSQFLYEKLGNAFTGNTYGVTAQARESLLSDLKSLMTFNRFNGSVDIVANAGIKQLVDKLAQFGGANIENKQMQYNGLNFNYTNNVANAVGKGGSGYAIEAGTIGMLTRCEYEAVRGAKSTDGREMTIVTLPKTGIQCAMYHYAIFDDKSAVKSDMGRVIEEKYEFSFDAAMFGASNSSPSTIPTPIIKFDMESGNTSSLVTVVNTVANPVIVNQVPAS